MLSPRMATHPWLSHYDDDVRPSLAPYPGKTLLDYLENLAREHPSRPALLFKGGAMSSGRLEAESRVCGRARRAGRPQRRPCGAAPPQLPSVPDRGVRRLEGRRGRRGAESHLQRTRARARARIHAGRAAVTLTPFYERLKRVQGRTGIRHVIATSIKEYLPPLLKLLFTLFQ